jgi:acetyl-CoA acyltransferase
MFDRRYPDGMPHQGVCAELIAAKWGLTRTQLDEFALASHAKAAQATRDGGFANELFAMPELGSDEGIRAGGTIESMAALRPVFYDPAAEALYPQINWVVTAGSSSQISDASCALMLTSSEMARKLGLKPRVRVHATAVAGDDPVYRLTALIPATHKVLKNAGMKIGDIDLFEISEAFSAVPLAWRSDLDADLAKMNVHGGAIALGHPIGASGGRLMTTLINAMEQRGARFGLQAMCEGGGVSNATILELLS